LEGRICAVSKRQSSYGNNRGNEYDFQCNRERAVFSFEDLEDEVIDVIATQKGLAIFFP